jgi:hypothetical protein
MNCVYIIIEKFTSPAGNVEQTTVCAALNEEEAKHKVKYLNENVIIPFGFKGYTVKYEYTAISLETNPSWLLDMK